MVNIKTPCYVTLPCVVCGNEATFDKNIYGLPFCKFECQKKWIHSTKSQRRGQSFLDYGPNWTLELREFVRSRDNYTCQKCGEQSDKTLDVHHKVPYRISKNNSLNNLISLCKRCHNREDASFRSHHHQLYI